MLNYNCYNYYCLILLPVYQYLSEVSFLRGFVKKHALFTTIIVSILLNVYLKQT